MLNAIVFDFDGVIVDSEPLHYQAFVMVGKSIGFEFTYDQYLAQYIGFDDRDAFRLMLAVSGQDADADRIAELCAAKQSAFDAIVNSQRSSHSSRGPSESPSEAPDRLADSPLAIPGVLALIDECRQADLPIAIASGATRADIDLMLELLGRSDRFDVIVTADDVAHSKPDPASYALATERLDVDPFSTLAIEDTEAGLASAKGAGLLTLGLTTTGPAEPLQAADRVIDDLTGVTLEKLRRWYA